MKLIRRIGFLPFAEGSWRTGVLYSETRPGTLIAMSKWNPRQGWCTWDSRIFSGSGDGGFIWSMREFNHFEEKTLADDDE